MFCCVLLVLFRDFRENSNFRETRKSRKCDLAKLAKLTKISRKTGAFSGVSCFAKILKRVSSKTLLEVSGPHTSMFTKMKIEGATENVRESSEIVFLICAIQLYPFVLKLKFGATVPLSLFLWRRNGE
jgi:hypothetical protein